MFNFINKILFLKKSKASFNIILFFLLTKIKNIFVKSEIKKLKKNNIYFLKNKNITHDYFSSHAYNFYSILKKFNYFNFLEIGSFEGNASMFVARNFPDSKIICVDNWAGTEEYKNLNFKSLEENFDDNVREFKNIKKIKCLSDEFFIHNKDKFDVIYIDGYHKASQVYKDFQNAWNILKIDGVIIFDDYIWKFYDKINDNPCYAINSYLGDLKNCYKVLRVSNSQLFIKKNERS
jgi:predicted O-methyltransferase YrrM